MTPSFENFAQEKITSPEALSSLVDDLRTSGMTIATLNGSFDLLHAGHMHIIYEASLVADVLIMLLNSDASIKEYKSPTRPIVPLEYRLQIVSALEFVDYVSWFDETDPRAVLEIVKPDVHVNGAEYSAECLEAEVVREHGGEVRVVDLVPGLSTTEIINKIKDS